jgi:hypothetical protein
MYTFELEFHDSNLNSIVARDNILELRLDKAVLLVSDSSGKWLEDEFHIIPAILLIKHPKYTRLPKAGCIYDGRLDSKAQDFVGTIPLNLVLEDSVRFFLTDEEGEVEILGEGFEVVVEKNHIPKKFL